VQDQSFITGGIVAGTAGSGRTFTTGDFPTNDAAMVMVENFSPIPVLVGAQTIPAMWRKTFAIDNYPSLGWKLGINPPDIVNYYKQRLVRVLLDPQYVQEDGPVYPTPLVVTGHVGTGTIGNTGRYVFGAGSALGLGAVGTGLLGNITPVIQAIAQAKDAAFMGLLIECSGLDSTAGQFSIQCDNPLDDSNLALNGGISMPLIDGSYNLAGKDYAKYLSIPGFSRVIITMSQPTSGIFQITGWVGFHL
jgi:hypothetical protein